MNRIIIFAISLLFTSNAFAGAAYDLFGNGVLGLKWGDQVDTLKKAFPRVKKIDTLGITYYEIKDGRTVLGIERGKNDIIRFSFDSLERLNAVTVEFKAKASNFAEAQQKLVTHLGQPLPPDAVTYGAAIKWQPDNGVNVSLVMSSIGFSSTLMMVIHYDNLEKPTTTLNDLGL